LFNFQGPALFETACLFYFIKSCLSSTFFEIFLNNLFNQPLSFGQLY